MQYPSVTSLFKFISSEYLLETITNNSIYCLKPEKLNDPFDSKIYFSKKPRKQVIENIKREYPINTTPTQSSIITIPGNFNEEKIDLLEKYGEDFLYYEFIDYGLYSMTTDNTNLLMWSHYGEQHKGFCLEWERKPRNIFSDTKTCFPVNYSSYMPDLNYQYQNILEIAKAKFGSKNDVWAYEKEWRLISRNGNTNTTIDAKILGVYLGCKINIKNEKVNKVINKCRDQGIKLYQATVREREYKIDFIDFNG